VTVSAAFSSLSAAFGGYNMFASLCCLLREAKAVNRVEMSAVCISVYVCRNLMSMFVIECGFVLVFLKIVKWDREALVALRLIVICWSEGSS
jgi:hypothetical protein